MPVARRSRSSMPALTVSLVLGLALALTVAPSAALAADPPIPDSPAGCFQVMPVSGGSAISGYNATSGGSACPAAVGIPAEIAGTPIVAIGADAFAGLTAITSVRIPSSVLSIGARAFQRSGVSTAELPQGLQSIGDSAFQLSALTTVAIPDSVTSLGQFAFNGAQLTSFTLGTGITTIPVAVFGSNHLTNVTIPGWVTGIDTSAFVGNDITSLTFTPGSLQHIGDTAFGMNALTSVSIPAGVTDIGVATFAINNLSTLSLPDTLTSIGVSAFVYNKLTAVTIPDSVVSLGATVFSYNPLVSLTVGSPGYTGAPHLAIPADEFDGAVLHDYSHPPSNLLTDSGLTSLTLGPVVSSIGDRAFTTNRLTDVTVPGSVSTVGAFAFYDNLLTTVGLGAGVRTVGDSAFGANPLQVVRVGGNPTLPNTALEPAYGTRQSQANAANLPQWVHDNARVVQLFAADPGFIAAHAPGAVDRTAGSGVPPAWAWVLNPSAITVRAVDAATGGDLAPPVQVAAGAHVSDWLLSSNPSGDLGAYYVAGQSFTPTVTSIPGFTSPHTAPAVLVAGPNAITLAYTAIAAPAPPATGPAAPALGAPQNTGSDGAIAADVFSLAVAAAMLAFTGAVLMWAWILVRDARRRRLG